MADLETLNVIYRKNTGGAPTKFHVWEDGGAIGDSVTPSTYCGDYRVWLRDLLRTLLDESDADAPALLSLGCGNAAVEAGLVAAGYRVLGLDVLPEPVEFARRKGVDTVCADFFDWKPPPEQWVVVLADGFFGHIFDSTSGLRHGLERIHSWMPLGKGTLVISNDGPDGDSATQNHSDVPKFTWFSGPYLKTQAEAAGFTDIWSTCFTYRRPLSGPRERVIVTARS